ncbi:hypothetical protein CCAX7_58180 [Capsulimonas corticalis]|uniref:Uncharacterized protein n=1 Tax=Capsulimonas corticalis TaxID=2219043 RepID=A0A402D021_9BACT|nr:hypothetical protein [Capsulimonas corticalis]BDI33767.1 hypothetical protein CCAX7_58180 [Capsulimonas corticalis]
MFHTTDQDLLLLVHGELNVWRRIAAQAHLAVCPSCQTRLAKLVGASRLLADAVRGADLPRWSLPAPQEALTAARAASAWRLAALLIIVITMLNITTGIIRSSQRFAGQTVSPQAQPSGGCRPDLHNDKCR